MVVLLGTGGDDDGLLLFAGGFDALIQSAAGASLARSFVVGPRTAFLVLILGPFASTAVAVAVVGGGGGGGGDVVIIGVIIFGVAFPRGRAVAVVVVVVVAAARFFVSVRFVLLVATAGAVDLDLSLFLGGRRSGTGVFATGIFPVFAPVPVAMGAMGVSGSTTLFFPVPVRISIAVAAVRCTLPGRVGRGVSCA